MLKYFCIYSYLNLIYQDLIAENIKNKIIPDIGTSSISIK